MIAAFVVAVLLMSAVPEQAAPPDVQSTPPMPFESEGACPFECCLYREWSVIATTIIRARRDDASPVAFRVSRGEKVFGVTGVVITTKLGVAIVKQPAVIGEGKIAVPGGERLHLLYHMGEGHWKFWRRGAVDSGPMFRDGERCSGVRCDVEIIDLPQTVWWAQIRNARGQVGWTRDLRHFRNIDACG